MRTRVLKSVTAAQERPDMRSGYHAAKILPFGVRLASVVPRTSGAEGPRRTISSMVQEQTKLRWFLTVLTECTSEEGWRTKNELFVSALGLSSWHSQWALATHLGFFFWRLLPWQQTIVKTTIFLLFSTYLLPFLELASVKYLETRQSCKNDIGQYFNLKKWKIYLERS